MHYRICDRTLFEQVPSTSIYRWNKSNLPQLHWQTPRHNLKITACCVVLPPYCKYARLDSLESKTYEAKFIRWSNIFAVRLLEPGLLEEDCPITMYMCTENKRFSSFFLQSDQQNSRFNYATVENFKTVWPYLISQQTTLKFMNLNGPFAKKPWESLVLRNSCDWTINFLCAPVWVVAL